MVTIKDIARRAGVNPSVVSRALNNKYGVKKSTKELIVQIAEDLGYYPNTAARRLVTRKSGMIGIMMADISEPFYSQIIKGMEYAASKTGYTLLFSNSYENLEQADALRKMIVAESVDGLVIVGSNTQEKNFTKILLEHEIPFVLIERNFSKQKFNCLYIDNIEGGYMASKYLIKKGHRRIAHVAGNPQNQVTLDRIEGYKKALYDSDLSYDKDLIFYGNYLCQDGYEAMKKVLLHYPDCTAVFAANDSMAYGVLHAINESGLVVPKDLAVIGFDNLEFSAFTNPPLTTVGQPRYEMGKKSVEILTDVLEGRQENGLSYCLPFELIIRNSA